MNLFSWRRKSIDRPIDQAINEHKKLLNKWNTEQRKEIVAALLKYAFPSHHVHENPKRKAA